MFNVVDNLFTDLRILCWSRLQSGTGMNAGNTVKLFTSLEDKGINLLFSSLLARHLPLSMHTL